MQHPIDNMMQTTMENIRDMVDVNTVVGSPVLGEGGVTIIPISRVSFGFVAGGGEYAPDDKLRGRDKPPEGFPFAGGTGAGVSVQPVGFLVVGDGTVKVLPAQSGSAVDRIVELLPQLLEDMKGEEKPKRKRRFRFVNNTEMARTDDVEVDVRTDEAEVSFTQEGKSKQ